VEGNVLKVIFILVKEKENFLAWYLIRSTSQEEASQNKKVSPRGGVNVPGRRENIKGRGA